MRLDKRASESWTAAVLHHLAANSGQRAADIAANLGETDVDRLKRRIARLKRLG